MVPALVDSLDRKFADCSKLYVAGYLVDSSGYTSTGLDGLFPGGLAPVDEQVPQRFRIPVRG